MNTSKQNIRFDIVFFDFDGTLVESAAVKHQAFFEIFPQQPDYRRVVSDVLAADPNGSRHLVIPRMIEEMKIRHLPLPSSATESNRIDIYSDTVFRSVAACVEKPGAPELLSTLSQTCSVYVFSNTPDEALARLINARAWRCFVDGTFGYPHKKSALIRSVADKHNVSLDRVAVVGDSSSDEEAARVNGCFFFRVSPASDLFDVAEEMGSTLRV